MSKLKRKKPTQIIPLQQTNFDMVRNMTDAELAFFIVHQTGCDRCENFEKTKDKNCTLTQCSDYWLKWGQLPKQPLELDKL